MTSNTIRIHHGYHRVRKGIVEASASVDNVKRIVGKMTKLESNWTISCAKFEKLTDLHERLQQHLQECLHQSMVPAWIVKGEDNPCNERHKR